MVKKINNEYDDASIQVPEGLEAARERPGMYIGSTDGRGLHHLVYEAVDSAIDKMSSGYGNEINVTIQKDDSTCVADSGRRAPTGTHTSGTPTIEITLTVLHAGGKFGQGGYKTSGGLHGVGVNVVNALSKWLEVHIVRDSVEYMERFEDGGRPVGTLREIGKTRKRNDTFVTFLPGGTTFPTTDFSYEILAERLRESASLLKGVKITLADEREEEPKGGVFRRERSIKEFVAYLNEEKDTLTPIVYFSGAKEGTEAELAYQYNDGYSGSVLSFVSNVRTKDGGIHEVGVRTSTTKAYSEHVCKAGLLKEKGKNLEGSDFCEGLAAVLPTRVPENLLQFEDQTKRRLGTPLVRTVVDNVADEQMGFCLQKNNETSQSLVWKMIKAHKTRKTAHKTREESWSGEKRKRDEPLLSERLALAQPRNPKRNELYLVEGNSVGGSAEQECNWKF